jgi:large subunit ribosomal protein L35
MSRIKTHSGAKKRFKITRNGKIMHKKQGKSHLLMNKDKAHRRFQYGKVLDEVENRRIKALFPNG